LTTEPQSGQRVGTPPDTAVEVVGGGTSGLTPTSFRAAGAGDPYDSFEDLYRAIWPPAVRLAWLLSGSRELAEDIVHDAFLRVEATWQELADPLPYFRRMVINGVRSEHRHALVERRHRPDPPGPAFDPEMEEVWNVVAQLPDRERAALVLRFYLDMTVDQVADHLSCPSGTAKSLIHRGISHLREKVTP
jgi:RNA polymerase sigma factor (sigma-70 family)